MSNDPIQALDGAGIPVDQLSEAERAVLAQLSSEEVQTLVNIRKRLGGDDDTSGHLLSLPQSGQVGTLQGVQVGSIALVPRTSLLSEKAPLGSTSSTDVTGGLIF